MSYSLLQPYPVGQLVTVVGAVLIFLILLLKFKPCVDGIEQTLTIYATVLSIPEAILSFLGSGFVSPSNALSVFQYILSYIVVGMIH